MSKVKVEKDENEVFCGWLVYYLKDGVYQLVPVASDEGPVFQIIGEFEKALNLSEMWRKGKAPFNTPHLIKGVYFDAEGDLVFKVSYTEKEVKD